MKKRVERLRGMHDLLPDVYQAQRSVIERLGRLLEFAGYRHVDTPVLERSELFSASFGQELWQNLYSFRLHHRDLCLRPEYTASICRLYLDSYQQQALPLRFQYAGPIFRYEAPGRSRYRQHTQLGIELIGGHPWSADAELLHLACMVLKELDISAYRLELGHIGVVSSFINRLQLDEQATHLLLSLMEQISRSEEGERRAQERLEALYPASSVEEITRNTSAASDTSTLETHYITSLLNGISISFDDDDARREIVERFLWKTGRAEQRRQILYALDFLKELHAVSGPPPQVFEELRALLHRYELDAEPLIELEQLVAIVEQVDVPRSQILLNLSLGRGVSYYTGLVFEIHAQEEDGFDTQLCGGGRYDRLMSAVGSTREVKACGFAFGVERLVSLAAKQEQEAVENTQVQVIPVNSQELVYALQIAQRVRLLGLRTEVDISNHGVGAGLKQASRKHIAFALIVGESERHNGVVTLRDLATGEEQLLRLETATEYILHKGHER